MDNFLTWRLGEGKGWVVDQVKNSLSRPAGEAGRLILSEPLCREMIICSGGRGRTPCLNPPSQFERTPVIATGLQHQRTRGGDVRPCGEYPTSWVGNEDA